MFRSISATLCLLLLGLTVGFVNAQNKKPEGPPIPNDPVLDVKLNKTFLNLRIRRPIVITHAGDGSDRLFFAEQQGVIHVLPNDPKVEQTEVFLDIEEQVHFNPKKNEEGLLGFAFHPKYKENGEFFLYYTSSAEPNLSVISRFKASADKPNQADPKSEEVLLKIPQPYWNHNGGTLCFGPDGYLYIALGDGGSGGDPHGNGQKLSTLMGSILRIDVDKKTAGMNYAIPEDNPFVGHKFARPEIYAYGFRNVWRHSFDRETGDLWAGDVGQNLWEEIDIVTKGGNYGWNVREGMHKYVPKGKPNGLSQGVIVMDQSKLIDPIFEYHHNVGKSITGGYVYRGKKLHSLWANTCMLIMWPAKSGH